MERGNRRRNDFFRGVSVHSGLSVLEPRRTQVGANRAGLFLYLIPVFGIALAVTFLGERLPRK